MNYNEPWNWSQEDPRKKLSNTLAPLGSGSQEQAPPPQVLPPAPPTPAQQIGSAVAKEGINKGLDGALNAWSSGSPTAVDVAKSITTSGTGEVASGAGSQAAMLADQMAGFGAEGLSKTAEAAGGATSWLGPAGAAAGGLMEGKYDKAAGAAAGAMAGSLIPIPVLGPMIGAKIGGVAGDYIGNIFGLENGTTTVGYANGTMGAGGKGGGGVIAKPMAMAANQMQERTPATSGGKGGGAPTSQSNRGLPSFATNYYGGGTGGWSPNNESNARFSSGTSAGGKGGSGAPVAPTTPVPFTPVASRPVPTAPPPDPYVWVNGDGGSDGSDGGAGAGDGGAGDGGSGGDGPGGGY